MSKTLVLNPFQQKAFSELCQFAMALHSYQRMDVMQEELWELLKSALDPGHFKCQDAVITSNMLCLYEKLEAMITAVYGLAADPYRDKKSKKKTKKKRTS